MIKQVGDKKFRELIQQGWMSPEGAARRWGLSPRTVFGFIKKNKVDGVQHVSNYFYLLDPAQRKP